MAVPDVKQVGGKGTKNTAMNTSLQVEEGLLVHRREEKEEKRRKVATRRRKEGSPSPETHCR